MSEKRQKHVSNFADSYKRKNNAIDSRSSRAHRRSIEWKGLRNEEVNKRRNIRKDLSPLKEEQPKPKQKKEKETNEGRKEKLAKWKAERELKKKLDAEKKAKKPGFKVTHVPEKKKAPKQEITFAPLPKVKGLVVPNVQPVVDSKRVTRSRATAPPVAAPTSKRTTRSSVPAPEPTKPSRSTRAAAASTRSTRAAASSKPAPAAAKKTTAKGNKAEPNSKPASRATKATSKAAQPKGKDTSKSKLDNRFVTERGEPEQSFAPMDFVFTAPENIKSFTFKAMSPKSAAAFLYPSMPDIPSPVARRCSTPKVSGFGGAKVIHSPGASIIVEAKESSGSETEQPAPKSNQEPVKASVASSEEESHSETEQQSSIHSQRSLQHMSASPMLRRSKVAEITESSDASEAEPAPSSVRSTRRKSRVQQLLSEETGDGHSSHRRSQASELSCEDSEPAESATPSTRRRSRVQQLASETSSVSESESSDATTTPAQRRRSTRAASSVSRTPGSRRVTRRSIAHISDPVESDVFVAKVNTSTKKSRRGSVAKAVAVDNEAASNPEPLETDMIPEQTEVQPSGEAKDNVDVEENKPSVPVNKTVEEHEEVFGPLTPTPRPVAGAKRAGSLSADRCFARPEAPPAADPNQSLPLFRTPASVGRRPRMHSEIPPSLTPAGSSPWRRTDLRNSFVLKGLSPEDCVEVLKNSPMVEMKRRTPKVVKKPAPALDFHEVEELMLSMEEEGMTQPDSTATEGTVDAMETQPAVTQNTSEMMESSKPEQVSTEPMETAAPSHSEGDHDVPYFRSLLKSETARLNALSDKWNTINDTTEEISEEVRGQIRTVVGQAQLLIAQRFLQFSGLVDDCEFKRGEKETTFTDLQGFWDMIYFQVEDVDAKFGGLDKLREADWKQPEPEVKKVTKKKPVGSKAKSSKPVGRSKFAEFRARLAAQKAAEAAVPIIVMEGEEETKTFDAGFFAVSSPVRSPKTHCEGRSPALQLRTSRRSLLLPPAPEAMDTEPAPLETKAAKSELANNTTETSSSSDAPHDVPYFRSLLKSETDRLNGLSDKWNTINDSTDNLTEDVRGQIRTVVGQAQLLIAQRFLQFSGLVDDCEFKRGEKETTCTDLQGFWDMIYFQIEDVDAKFVGLDKLREADWKQPEPEVKKVIKKKPAAAKAKANKPVGRSKFAEFRARMAAQKAAAAVEEDSKTFDAGFFAVRSPVRSPKPHCDAGSPARGRVSGSPALGRLSQATTPACSPVMKAVLERNARRSQGRMSMGYLLAPSTAPPLNVSGGALPGRLSGTPTPSPLLTDSTQTPTWSALFNTTASLFTPEGTAQTPGSVRRSKRKSVRLNLDPEMSDEKECEDPLLKFLAPSTNRGTMDTTENSAPQDAHIDPVLHASVEDKMSNTPKLVRGRRSLTTSERRQKRRSVRRSVHFAVRASPSNADNLRAPSTPYNRDSLVPRRRRSSARSSISEDLSQKENLLFTPPDETDSFVSTPSYALAKLSMDNTPQRKNKRISGLGFTPPAALSEVQPLAPVAEDSFSNLMVFSPVSSHSPATKASRRRSVRNSTSLL